MAKTIAAIAGGVALGIAVALSSAGAFQFPWGSGEQTQPPKNAQTAQNGVASHEPAPPNAPEPNEVVNIPSWAPMVKKVMPTVVNVAITEEVKESGPFGPEGDEGGGQAIPGPGGQGNPFGPGSPFGENPFEQFRHFF
jgi:S1-C subfamily serine protease